MAATNGAKFLDERLMKAADVLLHHGEPVTVIFRYADGTGREARIVGRGEGAGTVNLAVWSLTTGQRVANRPIRFEECELDFLMAARLEQVARAQEQTESDRQSEKARALAFIEFARQKKAGGMRRVNDSYVRNFVQATGRRG